MYLGYAVGKGVIKPEVSKLKAFLRTTSKMQVREFLGLTGYYKKFIVYHSSLALPLTYLT